MIKNLRFYLVTLSLLLISFFTANAQNCTINAGQNRTICPGSPFILTGTSSGNFAINGGDAVWSQVTGPAVNIANTTVVNGLAEAKVTGFVINQTYKFRLSAKCKDGSPIFAEAEYTVSNLTVSNLGPDRVECPGTISLIGTPLKGTETGSWEKIGSGTATLTSQINGNANINLPSDKSDETSFRYTISDGSCSSSDTIVVRNLGGQPVSATSLYAVSCYTVTTSQKLTASYSGTGFGQIGTWSFISGPSTPSFNNINSNTATVSNLIEGTYKLRWTVVGTCRNGTADVTINVGPASQNVTNAGGVTSTYCDARTSTNITGIKPLYTNEIVSWVKTAGPAVMITNGSTFNPTISGLDGTSNYDFNYTITNTLTNCTSIGVYKIRYTKAPSISLGLTSPQFLTCDISKLDIPFTPLGGNVTSWALISGPSTSSIAINNTYNDFKDITGTTKEIIGMTEIGTYVIRFKRSSDKSIGGCLDAYADITIIASKTPYTAVAGTAQLLACNVTTATLAGNNPQLGDKGSGQWSQVSGPNMASFADKKLSTTAISNLITGVYTFRWIVSGGQGGCLNTQDDAKVVVAALPTIVNAGTTINTCFATPIKLNGNIPLLNEVGTWSVVSESPATPLSTILFNNINDPKAIATGFLANKTYTLKWTISSACGTINDVVNISTDASNGPKQAVAGLDQCFPSPTTSFKLAGNVADTGENGMWTLLAGAPNSPTFVSSEFNTNVTGATVGTYTFEWKITRGICLPTTDTVRITIAPITTVAIVTGSPSQNICASSPISAYTLNLLANKQAANETGTWTQVEGPGGAVINNPNSYNTANVTGLIAARYKFRWTISNSACSSSSAQITYNIGEPPSAAVAGSAQNLCDLTTTTLAATPVTEGIGIWSVVSGPGTPTFSDVNSPNSSISNLTKIGVYTLKWTISNGPFCGTSSDNVIIKVSQSAKAGVDQDLCNTTSTVLTGNEGSTGIWTQTGGVATTITTNSNNTAIVTGLADGSYEFTYTITSGGCGVLSKAMTVKVSGPPSIADAGADQNLCTANGTTVNLLAAAPTIGSGVWSFVVGGKPTGSVATIATPTNAATAINGLTVAGVYLLEYTITNANCSGVQSNKDIVRVTVYAPPTTVAPIPAQTSACKDGVILKATTPIVGIGTWTYVSADARIPVITLPNSPITTITGLAIDPIPYIFRWTITNGTCISSSQDVSITVVEVSPPVALAGNDVSICTTSIGGTGSQILSANGAGTSTGTWTVVGTAPSVPVFISINDPNTTVSNLRKGVYTLKWTISNTSSCTTQDEVVITVFDPPTVADAGPATASYCLYSTVQLSATATISGKGTWSINTKPVGAPDPVFSNVNAANATVNGLELGNYSFLWTTSNGPCAASVDNIAVVINNCQVAIAKSVGTPAPTTPAGSYNVTFKFNVKNTGNSDLINVQVQDELSLTFPTPKTFSIVSLTTDKAYLIPNPSFTGITGGNLNLLGAGSTLAASADGIITLVVKVKIN